MKDILKLRIILEKPPAGVAYAIQKGKGSVFSVIEKRHSTGNDLVFNFEVDLQIKDGLPVFTGPLAQGTPTDRFVYIGIGKYAGQHGSAWDRRLKIPLTSIDVTIARQAVDQDQVLETTVPGTAKDGTPACATVKPFRGWFVKKDKE